MSEYVEAFTLGNAAILTNVCLLPLYPGLFALLASRSEQHGERGLRWLGLAVLAGVLTTMTAIAAILYGANWVFADIFTWLLPIAYGGVVVLGVLMLLDRNPLARLGTGDAPLVSSPVGSAYLYGVALAPMTLPCTGPIILSAFVLGGVSGSAALADGVAYFLAFGLGFGWPLVLLPLVAGPVQRRFTGVLTRNHRAITFASGVLLIAVAIYGFIVEYD